MNPRAIIYNCCDPGHPHSTHVRRTLETLPEAHLFVTTDSGREGLGEELWSRITACGHIVTRVHKDGTCNIYVLNKDYQVIFAE